MKKTFISFIIFSASLSAYGQLDVVVTEEGAPGGKVQIKNDDNNANAFAGITNGKGAGLYGLNTSMSGIVVGIRGSSASITHGSSAISGVTGVYGLITTASAGDNSAGVRGINNGTGFSSVGVIGYQAGSGRGVYGETPSGFGVYGFASEPDHAGVGVKGATLGNYGAGVEAAYSGTGVGTALQIDNGTIKVSGSNRAAFVHTATVANKIGTNSTDIDNPMCNGDPNCLVFITQRLNPEGLIYNNSPVGVFYNSNRGKWVIFNEGTFLLPTNAQFNVLIIKQ
ncbi:DUF7452 domain-containing protein [Emticicia agri]|uniref:DUF7452 domain-containing protein n=1 Tax=Emticicia agri TaxID=2492393 RepID=A0A4Q5LZL0_9BACT|nr:hypothetical protein [Emticicia agri]RYU95145.1 hypothetical protein EWM59_12905 [Emticicia agri]